MISEKQKNNIIDTADVVDVIGDFMTLKKKGTTFSGKCPFHTEKTASFTVFPNTGTYKCFGCGASGDAVEFVKEHEKISFPESLRYLARKYNIEIEEKKASPEDEKRQKKREQLHLFNEFALKHYQHQVFAEENALGAEYLFSRFSRDEVNTWKLGIAPDTFNSLTKAAKAAGFKEEFLLTTGLIKQSDRTSNLYDFFRNRIIFPIHSKQGRVISFTGREVPTYNKSTGKPEKSTYAKYINLPETELYHKKQVLYGLNQAQNAIRESGAVIVEGNPDVIACHTAGKTNAVAPSGTALTIEQGEALKRLTQTAFLFYDGDKAGRKAAIKNGEILLKTGFQVYVVPVVPVFPERVLSIKKVYTPEMQPLPKYDPFDISRINKLEACFNKKQDYILLRTRQIMEPPEVKSDPSEKNKAIKAIAQLLAQLSESTLRESYQETIIEQYKKSHKLTKTSFSKHLKSIADDPDTEKAIEMDSEDLPKYLTRQDRLNYIKYGFYESKEGQEKNQIYFGKNGRVSNFIIKPLYHIVSTYETRKLFSLTNKYGVTKILEMDMDEVNSVQRFRKKIESAGNFLWEGSDREFLKLKRMLYDNTKYCTKVDRLGWQEKAGFWAWANGISTKDGNFIPIDEYGIVTYNEVNYFIPAFSNIYIDDESVYNDERKFIYIENKVDKFYDYVDLYLKVHERKSMLSILYYMATLFSDYIFRYQNNFPILNFFGEKGSGKNEQAFSLAYLFGYRQNETQLNNTTKPGLSEKLNKFANAIALLDEYKVGIDPDINEILKGIYNRNGRSKGSMRTDVKTEQTPISMTGLIMGQEQTTQDVALFERLIYLSYAKRRRTQEQMSNFHKLKNIREKGLSQFTHDLLKYRTIIESSYRDHYLTEKRKLEEAAKGEELTDRMINSYSTLLTTYKTLENHIELPFTYDEAFKMVLEIATDHAKQLSNTDELGQFWGMMETLLTQGKIAEKQNFRLEIVKELKMKTNQEPIIFNESKQLLMLRWSGLYQLYAENCAMARIKPIPENTLKYYLQSSAPFIGRKNPVRFSDSINTGWIFDYDMLDVNLEKYNPDDYMPPDDIESAGHVKFSKNEYQNQQVEDPLDPDNDLPL